MENIIETLNNDIKKNQSATKITIIEIKNTLDGINRRLDEAEKQISDLEDRVMESNPTEVREKKKLCKMRIYLNSLPFSLPLASSLTLSQNK